MAINITDQAFLEMIEQHKGMLYKVARLYCPDAEARRDLIQEMMVQLWRAFPKLDTQQRVSTWLYRIALNVAISAYRKASTRSIVSNDLPKNEILSAPAEADLEEDPRLGLLMQFIAELKELDRALMLLYLEEKDQQDIADILGISVSNVSTRVHRVKQKLATRFQQTTY
ncbi:MAG: sigma-70 family RNA polymerase sigma factor [Bacteroidota bacterium]